MIFKKTTIKFIILQFFPKVNLWNKFLKIKEIEFIAILYLTFKMKSSIPIQLFHPNKILVKSNHLMNLK